jgi:hypothetical protein
MTTVPSLEGDKTTTQCIMQLDEPVEELQTNEEHKHPGTPTASRISKVWLKKREAK